MCGSVHVCVCMCVCAYEWMWYWYGLTKQYISAAQFIIAVIGEDDVQL